MSQGIGYVPFGFDLAPTFIVNTSLVQGDMTTWMMDERALVGFFLT